MSTSCLTLVRSEVNTVVSALDEGTKNPKEALAKSSKPRTYLSKVWENAKEANFSEISYPEAIATAVVAYPVFQLGAALTFYTATIHTAYLLSKFSVKTLSSQWDKSTKDLEKYLEIEDGLINRKMKEKNIGAKIDENLSTFSNFFAASTDQVSNFFAANTAPLKKSYAMLAERINNSPALTQVIKRISTACTFAMFAGSIYGISQASTSKIFMNLKSFATGEIKSIIRTIVLMLLD